MTLATADVWTVLDLIVAEFTSDPTSVQCFDLRLVDRAVTLVRAHREAEADGLVYLTLTPSQRMALIHIVSMVMDPPVGLRMQAYVDVLRQVETTPGELFNLLMRTPPPI